MKKLLAMLVCIFMLSACTSPKNTQTEPTVPEDSPTSIETQPVAQETTASLVSFTAYRGNENADGLLSREVFVPEIMPEAVLSALIADGVVPETVSALAFTQTGDEIALDLNNAFSQYLCSMGTAGETITVNSVVNTFLSAYHANSIRITIEGNTLALYDFPLTHQE